MSGLIALDLKTLIAVACVVGAIQVAVHILRRAVDLWFDAVDRRDPIERLADSLHDDPPPYVGFDTTTEIAPEDEPIWDEKAPLKLVPYHFALAEQAVVLGGDPAQFDLPGVLNDGFGNPYPADATPEETSGRHARVDGDDTATGLMPVVVDDERALAVVASVSGVDGPT